MRVLLAPDAFTGLLPAGEVAAAMARGWASAAPDDVLDQAPLSDGGPGFVTVLHDALGGELVPVTVRGPLGRPVPGTVLLVESDVRTAYVEAAEACGLHLLGADSPPGAGDRRDPTVTTSYGVGELLGAAVSAGARRVVLGVGGTATNDGGAGLLAALGAGPEDVLARGGLALAGLDPAALADLADVRRWLAGVELVLAAATDVPLLGFHGTTATSAEAKGATPEQAQALEAALGHYAELASGSVVSGRSLLAGSGGSGGSAGPARQPGAGAGGGIGFAVLLLGARYVEGVSAVAEAVRLRARVGESDLVLAAEATFDWESLRGGVVARVAELGLAAGVPAVVLAGEVLVGRRESMTLGLSGTYAIAERPGDRLAARPDVRAVVEARTARIARTWSHA
jgi:glycerate kinase